MNMEDELEAKVLIWIADIGPSFVSSPPKFLSHIFTPDYLFFLIRTTLNFSSGAAQIYQGPCYS